jgi:hypothetical protein
MKVLMAGVRMKLDLDGHVAGVGSRSRATSNAGQGSDATSHVFAVPTPWMEKSLGVCNACTSCHFDGDQVPVGSPSAAAPPFLLVVCKRSLILVRWHEIPSSRMEVLAAAPRQPLPPRPAASFVEWASAVNGLAARAASRTPAQSRTQRSAAWRMAMDPTIRSSASLHPLT